MKNQRLDFIDAMRGIAALLVVWTHASEVFVGFPSLLASDKWVHSLPNHLDLGRIGVVVFFAISGFVIPSSLRGPVLQGLTRFGIRRAFRLYPAYWLSVALAIPTSWWLMGRHPESMTVLANLSMVQEFLGFDSLQGLYWTLHIEVLFYIACAALFCLGILDSGRALGVISVSSLSAFALIMAATGVGLLDKSRSLHFAAMTFLHLAIMFWGALMRRSFQQSDSCAIERLSRRAITIAFSMLFMASMIAWLLGLTDAGNEFLRMGVAYSTGVLIFLAALLARPRTGRWAAYLGEISYSLYLLHPAVIYSVYWLALHFEATPTNAAQVLLLIGLTLLGSIVLAAASYRLIEVPSIEIGKKLTTPKVRAPIMEMGQSRTQGS